MYVLSALREKGPPPNPCHEPAGSPAGGQFCSGDGTPKDSEVSLRKVGPDQYQIVDARYGRAIRVQGVRGRRDTFTHDEAVRRMQAWLKLRKRDLGDFYKGAVEPHEFKDLLGHIFGAMRESQASIVQRFAIDPQTLDTAGHGQIRQVGYSPTKKKWYGWSHRAVYGFGIGDTIPRDVSGARFPGKPGDRITSDAMAKQTAQAFADSVS